MVVFHFRNYGSCCVFFPALSFAQFRCYILIQQACYFIKAMLSGLFCLFILNDCAHLKTLTPKLCIADTLLSSSIHSNIEMTKKVKTMKKFKSSCIML